MFLPNNIQKVFSIHLEIKNERNAEVVSNEGLKIIEGDEIIPIKGSEIFKDDRVDFIVPFKSSNYLLGSRTLGVFTVVFDFINKNLPTCKLDKFETEIDDFIIDKEVTHAIQLSNKNYAVGSTKAGVIILDKDFHPISIINGNSGLQDEKVSFLYEDKQNNLWIALDNGISCAEINSPFKSFTSQRR